jgi:uncharacterized membrane protein YozB (DUF420 family)
VNVFFLTSSSGWIAILLIATELLLPYLLRPSRIGRWLQIEQDYSRSYLQRIAPHYWLGYLLIPLALLHAWIPMKSGEARRASQIGLWAAVIALCLLLLQFVSGLFLKNPKLIPRRQVRVAMMGIVVFLAMHVWMNS